MLEPPVLSHDLLIAVLQEEWRIDARQLAFLPLGADLNSAVYRVATPNGAIFFLKLRAGPFDEIALAVPKFLSDAGIAQIIPPLPTLSGRLWATSGQFTAILYPFVEGLDGYRVALSDAQWRQFGAAMRRIHSATLPAELQARVPRETFSPRWRDTVRAFLVHVDQQTYPDPIAAQLATFLAEKRSEILELVERADRLGQALRSSPPPVVLCHADLHAGNLLIAEDGNVYIVDWDDPILAPRERDLMAAGSGLMGGWRTADDEERLFYSGYGDALVDPAALMYYRCERIVADIAVYCQQLLLTDEGGEDRPQALRYLMSNFAPGGTIELAMGTVRPGD